jgi:hypothetical protein
MFQTLHACENGNLYKVELDSLADIADLVQEDCLESLTSSDCTIDFWLTPSLHLNHRSVNRTATELLLATTRFDARTVPLLRGNVALASHDSDGNLAGLAEAQIRWLINSEPTRRDEWTLGRRFSDDERRQHRVAKSDSAQRNSLRRPWRSIP